MKTLLILKQTRDLIQSLDVDDETASQQYRAVDCYVAEALGWRNVRHHFCSPCWRGVSPQSGDRQAIPNFTISIDDVRRVVPTGWLESYTRHPDGVISAACLDYRTKEIIRAETRNITEPAVALLIAVLSVHISIHEQSGIQVLKDKFTYQGSLHP